MSTTTVEMTGHAPINWNAQGDDATLQRVRNLLSLHQYEVAFDRGRGIDPDLVEQPQDCMLGVLTNGVSEMLAIYEPMVELVDVSIGQDQKIKVTVRLVK